MDTSVPPIEAVLAENDSLKQEVAQLRAQIAWLKKRLFGGGRSEKLDRAQLLLQLEELEKRAAEQSERTEQISYERRVSQPAARTMPAENFAHLPVRESIEIIPEEVQAEPEAYERIGEERTFEVDVVPPQLFKREFVRPKFRHRHDREAAPVVAPAPPRPVAGGYAAAGLVAWVLLNKYVDHLPLARQEKMSRRWGARISRQTMADWVGIAGGRLEPIYRCMQRRLLEGDYVQVDETPVRCRDPDAAGGQTAQGWLWVISRPGEEVVFEWRRTRRHNEVTSLLDGYRGVLQSDGYEAYPAFVRSHPEVVWVGCWAHARRKFFEAQNEAPKPVRVILKLIGRLYRLERAWDQAGLVDAPARAAARREHFARTLHWLRRLSEQWRQSARPQSLLGKACGYLLNHWEPLTAHLEHGQTRLDNNLIEQAIRPSAIGKKNWLFIGHPDAGDRSAIIYSLVVSCQRFGHDPLAYLRDVLTRLPAMTNQDDLAALTPAHWQPA